MKSNFDYLLEGYLGICAVLCPFGLLIYLYGDACR